MWLVFEDHVYFWIMCTTDTAIECRSIPATDTSIDTRSTLDRHSVDISVATRSTVGLQTFNFRWHAIECQSILAVTTRSMSVDISIATLWSAVSSMSVVCQWYFGGMSVTCSSQYPTSNGGILSNTPSASVRSTNQRILVYYFSDLLCEQNKRESGI